MPVACELLGVKSLSQDVGPESHSGPVFGKIGVSDTVCEVISLRNYALLPLPLPAKTPIKTCKRVYAIKATTCGPKTALLVLAQSGCGWVGWAPQDAVSAEVLLPL